MTAKGIDTLIQLIGSNPLPNYLSAMTLQPRKIVMIYTDQTNPIRERLATLYENHDIEVQARRLQNARDPSACRGLVTPDLKSSFLDYTGETKVMTLNIFAAWSRQGGDLARIIQGICDD